MAQQFGRNTFGSRESGTQYFSAPGGRAPSGNINPAVSTVNQEAAPPTAGLQYIPGENGFETGYNTPSGGSFTDIGGPLAIAGQVAGSRELGLVGSGINAVGAAQKGNYQPAGSLVGGLLAGQAGSILGGAAGLAGSANVTGKRVGDYALGAAVPGYGLVNALSGGRVSDALLGSNINYDPKKGTVIDPTSGLLGNNGQQDFTLSDVARRGLEGDVIRDGAGQSFSAVSTGNYGLGGMGSPTGFGQSTVEAPSFLDSYGGGMSSSGDTAGSGYSGADTGGAEGNYADGGMVGLNRYADGGMVQPMLAQALYADGGQVGMDVQSQQPMDMQMADMKINNLLAQPGAKEQVAARARRMMQEGSLTPDEVQKMAQVARACMTNPALYPQLRAFALKEKLGNLPQSYDQNTVMQILTVAKALANEVPQQDPAMQGQPEGQQPQQYASGGVIMGPGTGRSDSIKTTNRDTGEPVAVSNGEYIIPEHVVKVKGKEFFDNLLRKYSNVSGDRQGA